MTRTVIVTYKKITYKLKPKVANSFVKRSHCVHGSFNVSEMLFQVMATKYFTDFKPKRVVLKLVDPSRSLVLTLNLNRYLKYSGV